MTKTMAMNLKNAFDRLGELHLPQGVTKPTDLKFETTICPTHELLDKYLKMWHAWDVFVIDCRFGEGRYSIPILESLRDLRQGGVKIVWTAYTEDQERIECMRLGAWSYIDKTAPMHENTFVDVVVEVLGGIRRNLITAQKMRLNAEGCDYIGRHYDKLCALHRDKFVAFEHRDKQWRVMGEADTLCGLYVGLQGSDRNGIFIALFKTGGSRLYSRLD